MFEMLYQTFYPIKNQDKNFLYEMDIFIWCLTTDKLVQNFEKSFE